MNLYDTLPTATRLMRAIRDLGGPGKGVILGYYPVARLNPYQAMLYSQAWQNGFAPVGLFEVDDLNTMEMASVLGTVPILHIHWTSNVTARAESEVEASDLAKSFVKKLQTLKDSGVVILWTVHNVLPHASRFLDVEVWLRRQMVEIVDIVHVMAPSTTEETQPHYTLPSDRLIEVPHPSYIEAYPRHHDKRLARFELGYRVSDLLVGMVGSIQPYKGIDVLIEASSRARPENPDLKVLIAGLPGRDDQSASLLRAIDEATHIRCLPRSLDTNEVSLVTSALSAVVLPYRASLNSGAALLALSFGVPIVAPRVGHFRDLIDRGFGLGYENGDVSGLTSALLSLPDFLDEFDAEAALDYCETHSARRVSQQFFDALTEFLASREKGQNVTQPSQR